MRKLISLLRRTSVLRRLLYLSLLQVLVIALLCVSTVRSTLQELRDSMRLSATQTISVASGQLRQAYTEIDTLTKFPVMQAAYGRTSIFDYLSDSSKSYTQLLSYYRNVQVDLLNVLVLYSDVTTLGISNMTGTVVYCNAEASAYSVLRVNMDDGLIRRALAQKGGMIAAPGAQYASLAPALKIDGASWLGVRALMKLNHFEAVGVVLCGVDLSPVTDAFELARLYEEQALCVLDPSGETLIGEPMAGGMPDASDEIRTVALKDAEGDAIWQIYTNADGFIFQIRTPRSCLLATVWNRLTGLLIALATLVVSALLFTIMLVLSIRDPIAKLVRVCERIREGDYSPIQDDDARDEMHTLISAFNQMAAHIEQLITEVYQKNILQAQTEMRLLRSQINPHFVYNTLETIRASALESGHDELAEMASLLGRTLRYGISSQSEPVPVAREIMNLEDYLLLMRIHLNGRLQYTVTLEPGVSRCLMIKLVLQPLVENAISHGLSVKEGEACLWIMGYFLGDMLCFVVSDNGVGIEPGKLRELTEYIEGRNDAYQSIGLRNTHRRIQLYYGEQYGLSVRSVLGRGTSIEVRLPRVENKEALV